MPGRLANWAGVRVIAIRVVASITMYYFVNCLQQVASKCETNRTKYSIRIIIAVLFNWQSTTGSIVRTYIHEQGRLVRPA